MRFLFLLLFTACGSVLSAAPAIQFEPNRGQTDDRVRYLARSSQGIVFFTDNQIVFTRRNALPVSIELKGGNTAAKWESVEPTGDETSYHVGRDPSRWSEHVPQYSQLLRRNVYPGIDAAWHGANQRLEYDFVLAPKADPRRIRLRINGAKRVYISTDGELVVSSDSHEIRQHKPSIYQTAPDGSRTTVAGEFRMLAPNEAGFSVGSYDPSKPLVIDPVIDFSTYLGGDGEDEIVYAAGGIVAGNTTSMEFPNGAPTPSRQQSDVFFRDGSSTRIYGGSGDDRLTAVLISGLTLLVGYTNSTDLPTTAGMQPNYAGGKSDGFLIVNGLMSYYGTTGDDRITGAAMWGNNCALTGSTTGRGLPVLAYTTADLSSIEDGPGGGVDGFMTSCTVQGGDHAYNPLQIYFGSARYFGGSGTDTPMAITSVSGVIFIAGQTTSSDFPNRVASSSARSGDSDAFVVRFASVTAAPTSILFGGSGADRAAGLAILQNGYAIGIAGTTTSQIFF